MMVGRVFTKSTKPKRKAAPKAIIPTTVTGRRVKRLKVSKPAKSAKSKTAAESKKVAKPLRAIASKKPGKSAKPKSGAAQQVTSQADAKTPKLPPVLGTE